MLIVGIIIAVWIVVVLVIPFTSINKDKKGHSTARDFYEKTSDTRVTKEFSYKNETGRKYYDFLIDDTNKRVSIIQGSFSIAEIPYSEIGGCEINIDSEVVGGVGRAIAGGLIAGGAGAIVGATTAKQQVQTLDVVIYRNSIENPHYTMSLISSSTPTSSFIYRQAMTFATNVNASIKAIIAQNAQQAREVKVPNSTTVSQPSDIQSRLAKLDNLKSSGVITTEEYEEKRKKIIDEI